MTDLARFESGRYLLLCPQCQDVWTHVEAAGEYDGSDPAPIGVYGGREHRIALKVWCETCDHRYFLIFTQHKGETWVEWVDDGRAWRAR